MPTGRVQPEDRDIVPEQFPALNGEFYRRSPRDYFEKRVRALMLVSSGSDHVREAIRDGVSLGTFRMQDDDGGPADDDDAMRDFVSVEAIAIQQHVCESFLRLFLAHRHEPECPWLEVARLRQANVFQQAVHELAEQIDSDEVLDQLRLVFRGTLTEPSSDLGARPDWEADGNALRGLLRAVLTEYSDHQKVYNSTKHGLAIVAGSLNIGLASEVGPGPGRSGPSLTWLEIRTPAPPDPKRWHKVTRWVDADTSLAFVYLVATQLDNLWAVARWRYLGEQEVSIHAIPLDALDEARAWDISQSILEIGQQLAYRVRE